MSNLRRLCLIVDTDELDRRLVLAHIALLPDYKATVKWLESLGYTISFAIQLEDPNLDIEWEMPCARTLDVPRLELLECGIVARYDTDRACHLMWRDKRTAKIHIKHAGVSHEL